MIDEALSQIDELATRAIERAELTGLAFAVTDAEQTLAVRTYGYADLPASTPLHPRHLMQIGSISKSFAAFIVMQEVEAGRLRLDVPATEYLPWLKIPSRWEQPTLHHLLTHTAGITMGSDRSPGAEGEVWALRDQEAAWAPGTKFWYSNSGFKTIGLILQRVTGQPFPQLLRDRIFEPLGMDLSEPAITNAIRPRTAVGYTRLYDDRIDDRRQPFVQAIWSESDTADGAISSTAEDMAAYARTIINRGRGLVTDDSFALMTRAYANDPDDPADSYGYGLKTRSQDGRTILGHSGGMVGYTSGLWIENGIGIVILQNCEQGSWWLAPDALASLSAAVQGTAMPPMPEIKDQSVIDNASDYAGIYRAGERTFTMEADGARLTLDGIAVERVEGDTFFVPDPAWDTFLLSFSREAGEVTEAAYGPELFANARHSGYQAPASYPVEWDAYPGHYRCHNPWGSNVRVFLRRGELWAAFSSIDLSDFEYPLQPLPDGGFRLGETPERMSFDTVINGLAVRTVLMGQDMFRVQTP